jgi:flagellar hook-associated protein 3 FlgL
MRIATQQQFINAVNNMQRSQSEMARLQEQASSGKRIQRPSDDPVASAQIVKLERELAQFEKFELNIDVTQRRLELQETILTDINTAVDRMRELTLKASSTGTLNDSDRKAIATEIRQMSDYAASLMNTKDSQGEYIFAGSKGFTQPYQQTGDGRYTYEGDGGQRSIQVSSELYLPSNDPGEYLFEAVSRETQVRRLNVENDTVELLPFASREAETRFADAVKNRGDLSFEVYLEPNTPESYGVRLRDSGGEILVDQSIGETTEFPYSFSYEGLNAEINLPQTQDLTFNAQPEVMGISEINLVDQQVAKTFAELYGDITLAFSKDPLPATTTGSYTLTDSDGDPISLGGQTSFPYTDGQPITVGGYELQLDTPATGQVYTLQPSLAGSPLPPLSNVSAVSLADSAQVLTLMNNGSVTDVEVEFDPASGEVLVHGVAYTPAGLNFADNTEFVLNLEAPVGTPSGISLTFIPSEITQGERLTIDLSNQPQAATEIRVTDQQKNLLDIAMDLADLLEQPLTPTTQSEFSENIARALEDFEAAASRNIESRTLLGSRLNALDSVAESNGDFKLFTKSALSSIQDLDYAEALSQFKLTELGLQAAQATFSRVQNLSLFDYLR